MSRIRLNNFVILLSRALLEHFIISLDMQSIPWAFLVLSLLIPCLISSRSKGLLSWSRLSLFLSFIFSLLNELQTIYFCKSFMKWSCISSNGGKSSLFVTNVPPVFNCFSRFHKLSGSVVYKVSSFLISCWSYLRFSFMHKFLYTFLNW